jgi:hypothetical protein
MGYADMGPLEIDTSGAKVKDVFNENMYRVITFMCLNSAAKAKRRGGCWHKVVRFPITITRMSIKKKIENKKYQVPSTSDATS